MFGKLDRKDSTTELVEDSRMCLTFMIVKVQFQGAKASVHFFLDLCTYPSVQCKTENKKE